MNKEKQIEEMAQTIFKKRQITEMWEEETELWLEDSRDIAKILFTEGYRKQSEGEWIKHKCNPEIMKEFHDRGLGLGMSVNSIYWTCSVCENWGTPHHQYCSSCGAKMKGGEADA